MVATATFVAVMPGGKGNAARLVAVRGTRLEIACCNCRRMASNWFVLIAGALVTVGTFVVTPRAGGDSITQRQRVFMILRRQIDGRWLFARGMSQPGPAA